MQHCWLVQENRPACILFLAGWGMDPAPFESIRAVDYDVLMVYDYREIAPAAILEAVQAYRQVHLLTWSMGVWIAGRFLYPFRTVFSSAMAINGTLTPIHAETGIPPEPFAAMIRHLSPERLEHFYRDMFQDAAHRSLFMRNRPDRPLESVREELRILQDTYLEQGPGEDIFSSRLVGSRDRIFSARSQVRSWGRKMCRTIKTGHFPFYAWSSWDRLIGAGEPG